jgi:type IV pilus assembly protein PilV
MSLILGFVAPQGCVAHNEFCRKVNMKKSTTRQHKQTGFMLLEGLLAILIFSLGILAVVGLQARSIGHSTLAKYRNDASFAANKLIGLMWVATDAEMDDFKTGNARFTEWQTRELKRYLPSVDDGLTSATVDVIEVPATVSVTGVGAPLPAKRFDVDIQIQWRAVHENTDQPPHRYRVVTQIVRNP